MKPAIFFKLLLFVGLYYVCIHMFQAEQILGIGRNFVYAIF